MEKTEIVNELANKVFNKYWIKKRRHVFPTIVSNFESIFKNISKKQLQESADKMKSIIDNIDDYEVFVLMIDALIKSEDAKEKLAKLDDFKHASETYNSWDMRLQLAFSPKLYKTLLYDPNNYRSIVDIIDEMNKTADHHNIKSAYENSESDDELIMSTLLGGYLGDEIKENHAFDVVTTIMQVHGYTKDTSKPSVKVYK